MFRKILDEGLRLATTSACCCAAPSEDVERGRSDQAGFDHPAHRLRGRNVYVLSKDEGGRHTPFFNNYRPQFTSAPPT